MGNGRSPVVGLTDLMLGGTVLVLALVPAALLMAGLADWAGRRFWPTGPLSRRTRVLGGLLGLLAGGLLVPLIWSAAAATHLKPLCLARAEPWYRDAGIADRPVRAGVLIGGSGPAPAWAPVLLGAGGFPWYEVADPERPGRVLRVTAGAGDAGAAASGRARAEAPFVVRVGRREIRSSAWAHIRLDRFDVRDRRTGELLGQAEEIWLTGGPARWRCGISSGRLPSRGAPYPDPDAIGRFVRRAVAGTGTGTGTGGQ